MDRADTPANIARLSPPFWPGGNHRPAGFYTQPRLAEGTDARPPRDRCEMTMRAIIEAKHGVSDDRQFTLRLEVNLDRDGFRVDVKYDDFDKGDPPWYRRAVMAAAEAAETELNEPATREHFARQWNREVELELEDAGDDARTHRLRDEGRV